MAGSGPSRIMVFHLLLLLLLRFNGNYKATLEEVNVFRVVMSALLVRSSYILVVLAGLHLACIFWEHILVPVVKVVQEPGSPCSQFHGSNSKAFTRTFTRCRNL